MQVRLTDSDDPFFLWQALITEDDYNQTLRREQNLLIDFGSFPGKLCELLDRCRQTDQSMYKSNEMLNFWGCRFSASLKCEEKQASLSIAESTTFKQICHLSLRLLPASEASLRAHMHEIVRCYKVATDVLL